MSNDALKEIIKHAPSILDQALTIYIEIMRQRAEAEGREVEDLILSLEPLEDPETMIKRYQEEHRKP